MAVPASSEGQLSSRPQKSPAERTFAQFAERLSFLTILDNFFTTNYRYHRDQKTKAFQCRTITAPGRKHSSREPP